MLHKLPFLADFGLGFRCHASLAQHFMLLKARLMFFFVSVFVSVLSQTQFGLILLQSFLFYTITVETDTVLTDLKSFKFLFRCLL